MPKSLPTHKTKQAGEWHRVCALAYLCCALLVGINGCGLLEPDTERFIIRIDTIAAPATSSASAEFWVSFAGYLGPNGCYRVARVERRVTPRSLDMTFHGERKEKGECTAMPVVMGHLDAVAPPHEDPFLITVHQPDGTSLERVVRIQ